MNFKETALLLGLSMTDSAGNEHRSRQGGSQRRS